MENGFSWFGIDFGTTNSAAFSFTGTSIDSIQPIQYGDDEGRPFPSVVAIDKKTGEVITGREAKDRKNILLDTHEYFSSIKSVIDLQESWLIAGKEWSPEDIAAEIFKALKVRIEKGNENEVHEAVVAVPVGFSPVKKRKLRNAAHKAGIDIKMFISEPTAAFCSNYTKLKNNKHIAVFDWGGGTLDVVVIKNEAGEVQELSAEGMEFAGNDIDLKLAEKMHARFMRGKMPTISFEELDATTKDQLLMKCEKAKCDFEDEEIVTLSINRYGGYGAVKDAINYDFFALLIEKDIENAIHCLNKAITKAGLNMASIDCIICVGGSSRLRPLRDQLSMIYGNEMIFYPDSVMWDIAKGAAITSTRLGGYSLNKSIGLLLSDGSYLPLFKRGQKVPCEEVHLTLGTVEKNENGASEARFIFTDAENTSEQDFAENFVLPLRGFVDEKILLSCYIDRDNIFKLKVGSNRMLDNSYKTWSYDRIKMRYRIEEVL